MKKLFFNGLLATTIAFAATPAQSEIIPGTTVSVHFESTHIVGSGRSLNMHRVPVMDVNTGQTTYFDVSFDFTLNPEKGLIFEQMSSVAISPPLMISTTSLVVGVYRDVKGYCFELESPTFLSDSRSLYLFKAVKESISGCQHNSNHTLTAQVISGAAVDHPGIGHRPIVKNLPDSYIYGIVSDKQDNPFSNINHYWKSGVIFGLMQLGNSLIVDRFTDGQDSQGNWNDFSIPVKTAILEKVEME